MSIITAYNEAWKMEIRKHSMPSFTKISCSIRMLAAKQWVSLTSCSLQDQDTLPLRTIESCLRMKKLALLTPSFTLPMILTLRLFFPSCVSRMDKSSQWKQGRRLSRTTTNSSDKIEFSRCRNLPRSFDRVCLPQPFG